MLFYPLSRRSAIDCSLPASPIMMNTTNTEQVVADAQPDADSQPPSLCGIELTPALCAANSIACPNLGEVAVNKQGCVSRLHTTRSRDALWKAGAALVWARPEHTEVKQGGVW